MADNGNASQHNDTQGVSGVDMGVISNSTIITRGPIFDEIQTELMDIYIYPFVFVIMYMVIGFLGNAIVIYIFTVKWKLTKTTVFILSLAAVDIMSCLINMPTEAAILWNPMYFDHDIMCKISRYTTFIASASSSCILVAISIDRYLMICRPFLGRELGVQYAKKTCFVAVIIGLAVTWPSLLIYGTYTYQEERHHPVTGDLVKVEVKTCLLSNFYVEHYKLPAGFYFFLFGGHVVMFVLLFMLYLLIGRRLYLSTNIDADQRKNSLKTFGLSMVSALTGTVPNTPVDGRDKMSLGGGKYGRALSVDNVNRVDQSPRLYNRSPRNSAGNCSVNTIQQNGANFSQQNNACRNNDIIHKETNSTNVVKNARWGDNVSVGEGVTTSDGYNRDSTGTTVSVALSNDGSEVGLTPRPSKRVHDLRLNIDNVVRNPMPVNTPYGRLSTGSSVSCNNLTPSTLSPMSPESVRGILYRSQSVESRARLNRIIADELRHSDVKEVSMRSNTLMMRMVTIAFVVSFLPYLVIVLLRYANNSAIPNSLSKAEQIVYHVFLRTYFINSMINPFIYGFMNLEFRAKLRELFCHFCTRYKIRAPLKL